MDRIRQAEIGTQLGIAIATAGVAAEGIVAYLKSEICLSPFLLLLALGLAITLVSMIYGRVVDAVQCMFCNATVPRFYSIPNKAKDAYACHVCMRCRPEYPFGSKNAPAKKACAFCNGNFYPIPLLMSTDPTGQKNTMICRVCIAMHEQIRAEVQQYAATHGKPITATLIDEWATEELKKPRPRSALSWAPFAMVVLSALALGIAMLHG